MALTFGANTTDKVGCGNVGGSDRTVVTLWCWLYPTAVTTGRRILAKGANVGGTGSILLHINGSGTGQLRTNMDYITDGNATSVDNALIVNTWQFIAATHDGTNAPKIYRGTLSSAVAEVSYNTQTAPSGGRVTDSGGDFNIGNAPTGASVSVFPGVIAIVGFHDAVLTLGELQSLQFRPRVTSSTLGFWHLGHNGTSTQPDWSGNGFAGTVTGATASAHVPLGPIFGWDDAQSYRVAAAAAAVYQRPQIIKQAVPRSAYF